MLKAGVRKFTETRTNLHSQTFPLYNLLTKLAELLCMTSVVLVVLHLRAYTLIARIGSNVGGIARLETCRD